MFEEQLTNYGALGVFVLYLIYDRQTNIKGLIKALNNVADRISSCPYKK